MQAIQLLKQEHGKAKAAFQEIEGAPSARRGRCGQSSVPSSRSTRRRKSSISMGRPPARTRRTAPSPTGRARTSTRCEEAEGLDQGDRSPRTVHDAWLGTVKKLRGALEQHIQKEEQQIWPKIEQLWNAQRLEEAGRQMEAMTLMVLRARGGPGSPAEAVEPGGGRAGVSGTRRDGEPGRAPWRPASLTSARRRVAALIRARNGPNERRILRGRSARLRRRARRRRRSRDDDRVQDHEREEGDRDPAQATEMPLPRRKLRGIRVARARV